MAQIITSKEAANLINDGDVIVTGVDGLTGWPQEIVDAIEERFLREGHPKNITSIRASGGGNFTSPTAELDAAAWSFLSDVPGDRQRHERRHVKGWTWHIYGSEK